MCNTFRWLYLIIKKFHLGLSKSVWILEFLKNSKKGVNFWQNNRPQACNFISKEPRHSYS